MSADHKAAEERLREALESSHAYGLRLETRGFPLAEFETLQAFQVQRLTQTYSDLQAQQRYRAAVEFFLDELYGGLGFRERDRQVQRVLPVMVRLLPESMLSALAKAIRLQAMSIELDIELCEQMHQRGWTELDDATYQAIYLAVPRVRREEQLQLIRILGMELCRVVRRRPILLLIRAMRGPAHAAGFGPLQAFLEGGLSAFRAMGNGGLEFIETVHQREALIMDRLYSGEADPFQR